MLWPRAVGMAVVLQVGNLLHEHRVALREVKHDDHGDGQGHHKISKSAWKGLPFPSRVLIV